MKVSNAGVFSKSKRVGPRVVDSEVFQLKSLSEDNLEVGSYVSLQFKDETFYFKVTEKSVENSLLAFSFEPTGFWVKHLTRVHPNVDPRELINLELIPISNPELTLQLAKESQWT